VQRSLSGGDGGVWGGQARVQTSLCALAHSSLLCTIILARLVTRSFYFFSLPSFFLTFTINQNVQMSEPQSPTIVERPPDGMHASSIVSNEKP